MSASIELYGGRGVALVDEADLEELSQYRWHLDSTGYAARTVSVTERMLMHRHIMGLVKGDGLSVDHINGNPLDNRRSNLRVLTHAANHQNRRGANRGSTSQFRGVSWDKRTSRWKVVCVLRGKQFYLGHFDDEVEAGRVAEEWRREHMPFSIEGKRTEALPT